MIDIWHCNGCLCHFHAPALVIAVALGQLSRYPPECLDEGLIRSDWSLDCYSMRAIKISIKESMAWSECVPTSTLSFVSVWTSAKNSATSWKCGLVQSKAPLGRLEVDPSDVLLVNAIFCPSSSSTQFGGKVPPASYITGQPRGIHCRKLKNVQGLSLNLQGNSLSIITYSLFTAYTV